MIGMDTLRSWLAAKGIAARAAAKTIRKSLAASAQVPAGTRHERRRAQAHTRLVRSARDRMDTLCPDGWAKRDVYRMLRHGGLTRRKAEALGVTIASRAA